MLTWPSEGNVHVWWARPADTAPHLETWLDPGERARRAAYRHDVDRDRFTVAAAIVRAVAAAGSGTSPARVHVDRRCADCARPHGPVRLPGLGLHVSVSHGGAAVVVAFATDAQIGVDVEPVVGGEVVTDVLTASERARVALLDGDAARREFVRLWTGKEAVLKATGDGLRLSPEGLELTGPDATTVVGWQQRPDACARLALFALDAPVGHEARLAVFGPRRERTITTQHAASLLTVDPAGR